MSDPIREAAGIVLARRNLAAFAQRVVHGYQNARHIEFLCGLLERVEQGELTRLVLTGPPGHGKSTLLQVFTSWFLGRKAGRRIIMISASEALARRNSRMVREIVTCPEFPFTRATGDLTTEALSEWELSNGSGVRSIGIGGVVTGFRCEGLVLDDCQSETGSSQTRDTLEAFWREKASTRLDEGCFCISIQTRWGVDDFVARLLEGPGGEEWLHVNLPAISEGEGDPLGRPAGVALWPERWSLESLEKKRLEMGSIPFLAQYLGRPIPEGGQFFRREDFEKRHTSVPSHMVPTHDDILERSTWGLIRPSTGVLPAYRIMTFDGALKTKETNDFSAFCIASTDGPTFYLEHMERARLTFPRNRQAHDRVVRTLSAGQDSRRERGEWAPALRHIKRLYAFAHRRPSAPRR